ncbi:ABC transporter ATP-binding protein [Pelagovum pacificum]|uniref:sn-glycerol-3-phosphate ABC transporter ATP-binding protein UgpC n=1 Tax=Pelagovum pacificum TaxID=2588711 RepID=A0A5C5G889_9RHOB|nr:sn-glycerol-3-phosphate ABC transporter ATP-binding protein UgpC [Pelagovum pacificum]QQA41787.1 sn-glycerol-3-phosphate ABC transporter ATP-binding protein UgpC [Pelagovum pacificum]TNY30771.1 sn-glycerol-3-phosphate ABC transporter ATP-binding protein UgpC [Pelagovum pacificum]
MATLQLENLIKMYGSTRVVHGINLEIEDKEFVVFVGPSGCGKSTTLRMVAGLEHISGGRIRIDDKVVNRVAPGRRDIAMVFQNYALYPHMSVGENLAFCLQQRGTPKGEVSEKVSQAAETLRITNLLDRRPSQLSGGQRQRVAMGRAIVREPKVFLFDEPLSNLDAKLRVQMRSEIKRLQRILPTTTVYVTHDQTEAMTMADRVVVMNGGHIEQVGRPLDLYERPQTTFVAGFIGSPPMNLLPGRLSGSGDRVGIELETGQTLPLSGAVKAGLAAAPTAEVVLGIRPEAISLSPNGDHSVPLSVVLDEVEPLGIETLAYGSLGETLLCARLGADQFPASGSEATLHLDMNRAMLFDAKSTRALG